MHHVIKIAQGLKGRVLKKKFVLTVNSWVFIFTNFSFFSWFYTMPSTIKLLQFECEVP